MKKSTLNKLSQQIQSSKIEHPCFGLEDCGSFLLSLFKLLFQCSKNKKQIPTLSRKAELQLKKMLQGKPNQINLVCESFFSELPNIHQLLLLDAQAVLDGDPAARSLSEVVAAYPGFFAIFTHRLAHQLFSHGESLVARMLSEFAHRETGIDIHPGAQIGASFCIDHGTGIVIGETCVIGESVKIYQGVTLGGLSVYRLQAGSKRHPTIEKGVVIYANATILGGKTIVGANSVIGANVWLTESVAANSKVFHQPKVHILKPKKR